MKNKLFLAFVFFISFLIFSVKTYNAVKYFSKKENDTQLTVLNQKISYEANQNFNKLLLKDIVKFNFKANYNNLGTIEVLFDTNGRMNYDWLQFRIKEKDSATWLYQNKYKTDQFNSGRYFPFGFPIINDSKNINYQIEIESSNGVIDDSVSINKKGGYFIAKYSFSKAYLTQHKVQILSLVIDKLKTYLGYIPSITKVQIIFNSLLPLIIWLIIIKKPLQLLNKLFNLEKNKKINKIFQWINPVILFLSTFIVSGYFATIGTDPHHDGILIKPAIDLANGKMLFRDSFTQYGAFTTIIQAVAVKFFGPTLLVIKVEVAFFYGLISVLLYLIWIRLMSKKLAFLSSVILLLLAPYYIFTFLPWSSVYGLFFQCLTLLFLIKHHESNNKNWLFAAGVVTALTFWCKQNIGAYVLLPSLIYIVVKGFTSGKKKRIIFNIVNYCSGGIVTSLIFLSWITFNGALVDWWKQSIILAVSFVESRSETSLISSLIPAFVSPQYVGFFSLWALMPIITIFTFIKSCCEKKVDMIVFLISLFCIFSWQQYYPINDIRHVYWSAAPMVGIVIYIFYEICQTITTDKPIVKNLLFIFLIWLVFYPDILLRINSGYKKLIAKYYSLNNIQVLKGMNLTKEEYVFYKNTSEEVNKYRKIHGNVNLITNTPNALYVTLTKSDNFHPMYVDWGNNIYPDYYLIKNDYIEKNRPLIISIWGQIHPGYCRLNNVTNSSDTAFLIAPCEKLNQSE